MKTLKIVLITSLMSAFAAFNLQAQYADASQTQENATAPDILDIAASDDRFSTLTMLLTETGLADVLRNGEEYTVFAPTDEAFADVPEETLNALMNDREMLQEVLLSHVVVGTVTSDAVTQIDEAQTASGNVVAIESNYGGVTVGNATVIEADIMASNGVIHVIDSVIIPGKDKEKTRSGYNRSY
ncbi:MAG: fasciclin domain-containing protein [Balneolales bacterium]|nr:fasciclin domain-containing protein [Balneolales bacterium]